MSAIEARVAATAPDATGTYYWIGYQHTGDFGTGGPFINWVGDVSFIRPWLFTSASTTCTNITSDAAFHYYRIERLVSSVRFYRDNVLDCEQPETDATDYSIQLRNQSPTNTLRVDWVRAMQVASPAPVVTVGDEQ